VVCRLCGDEYGRGELDLKVMLRDEWDMEWDVQMHA